MRPLEYVILFLDLLCVMWLFFPWRNLHKVTFILLAITSIATLIVHFMAEGYRWHMLPAYSLVIASVKFKTKNRFVSPRRSNPYAMTRGIVIAFGILYLTIAVALPAYVFPIFKFEKPTGPYAVGTVSRYWIDHSRHGDQSRGTFHPRELMVQIWYPAEPARGLLTAPYHPNIDYLTKELARTFGLPRLMLSNFHYVMSNSLMGAQISTSRQQFPVLFFSHAFNGHRFQNTFQVEELASHGYVVVGIDHSYVSAGTVFPDGRLVPAHRLDHFTEVGLRPFLDEWVADARFVLDQLSRINAADPKDMFTNRFDLNKVGYFGHSFGGAAAAQTLSIDSRFKAGINMDGYPFGTAHNEGIMQPFLHLQSDRSLNEVSDEELASMNMTRQELQIYVAEWNRRMQRICSKGHIIKIKGTGHFDFSDCPLWTPLTSWLGFTGKISPKRIHSIINVYTLAFFDKYFQGQDSSLLNGSSPKYPEVEYLPTCNMLQ
jgi:predicted dienelactone hydrolase